MNFIVTAEQMKNAERYMINEIGLPSLVLMEKAAERIVEAVMIMRDVFFEHDKKIMILCGCGNNGGDGIAAARILMQKDFDVRVHIVGDETKSTKEFKTQKNMYEKLGGKITKKPDYDVSLVIDAMIGIGISRNVEGNYLNTINKLNDFHDRGDLYVMSVDIPSGLNSDTGKIMGACVKADYTVCLGYYKSGLYLNDGPEQAGETVCDDIGIAKPGEFTAVEFDTKDLGMFMPERLVRSNKATYGKLLIIAGDEGMPGAAVLATRAALASGIGMVKLLTDAHLIPDIVDSMPEVMVDTYYESKVIDSSLAWCKGVLIGPGLGRDEQSEELFVYVMEHCDKPMVIDADGLYHLSRHMELLKRRRGKVTILTPHPGEFAKLFDKRIEDSYHQNIEYVKGKAAKHGVVLVAKDHNTIVTDATLSLINTTGSDALATAGTGDVLAGVIATMMLNVEEGLDAALLGTAIHGVAGCLAESDSNAWSVTASDVIYFLPDAIDEICHKIE